MSILYITYIYNCIHDLYKICILFDVKYNKFINEQFKIVFYYKN